MYCKDEGLLEEAAEEKLWSLPHCKLLRAQCRNTC